MLAECGGAASPAGDASAAAKRARPVRAALRVLLATLAAATLVASALLVRETARYFSFDPDFAFFVERPGLAADRVWTACFYVHVAGGMLCLVTCPLLLWNGIRNGSRTLHRAVGRIHAVAALGWVGPSGLYMAPFSKGGVAGQLGFGLLGIWFVATTLLGIHAIRRGALRAHAVWMLRSYSLVLSALSFRAIHRSLQIAGLEADAAYVASTWASLALALLAGELMIHWLAPADGAAALLPEGPA